MHHRRRHGRKRLLRSVPVSDDDFTSLHATLENNDSQPMPGTDGFHPFYSIPYQEVSSTLIESPLVYIGTKGMKRNDAKGNG